MIKVLFLLSQSTVSSYQFVLIVGSVLLLVLWTVAYVAAVDPLLRRVVGSIFGLNIQWRRSGSTTSWTPEEKTGCILGLFIDLLGYAFIVLWLVPFAAAVIAVLWFRH